MPKTRRIRQNRKRQTRRQRKQRGGNAERACNELVKLYQEYQGARNENVNAVDGRYNIAKRIIEKINESSNMFVTECPGIIVTILYKLAQTLSNKENAVHLHNMIDDLLAKIAPFMPAKYRLQEQLPIRWFFEVGPRNMP